MCSVTQLCLTGYGPMDYTCQVLCSWDFPGKRTGKITYFPRFFHWKMVLETRTCSDLLIIEAHLFTQAREG